MGKWQDPLTGKIHSVYQFKENEIICTFRNIKLDQIILRGKSDKLWLLFTSTHFWPIFLFYTNGFLVFPGGIKWERWPEFKELKDCKNLIAASAYFLTAIGKFFQGTRLSPLKFEVFLIFSYFLRFLVLSHSATRKPIHIRSLLWWIPSSVWPNWFYLWTIKILSWTKNWKVPKYYDQHCRYSLMSILVCGYNFSTKLICMALISGV